MLGVVTVLFVSVALFVDLRPVVDENFFFSTSDPGVRQTKKIEQHFPSKPELILTVSSHDISSSRYLERIQKLTRRIDEIDGVSSVKSLTAGPKSFQDAVASPFWSRLLISKDRKASNLIVFVLDKDTEKNEPTNPAKHAQRHERQADDHGDRNTDRTRHDPGNDNEQQIQPEETCDEAGRGGWPAGRNNDAGLSIRM